MQEELSNVNDEEQLKAENDFLKMKLMLEHGGYFSDNEDSEMSVPLEVENQFLNNILAFEKQFQQHKKIKIFDKVGRPAHFKPVTDIKDAEIDQAWGELKSYLSEHSVVLDVCSPNITSRELYRFATEELFEYETDDINLPGWSTNFIYDEFHPDIVFDNSRMVEEGLFNELFSKSDLFSEMHYAPEGLLFNGKEYGSFKAFSEKMNNFRSLFDEIEMNEFTLANCRLQDAECFLDGQYKASARMGATEVAFTGDFFVRAVRDELGYWCMKEIQINGFNP